MSGFFYLGGGGRSGGSVAAANSSKEEEDHPDKQESNYLYSSSSNRAVVQEGIYSNNRGFEIWPAQYYQQEEHNNNNDNNYATTFSLGRNFVNFSSDESSSRSAGAFTIMKQQGVINCQDCGNQAKKDCTHLRCRTCCKSRGFHCQTHVKSTWVPAAKRRERQQQLAGLNQRQTDQTSTPKRHRDQQHQPAAALLASSLPITTLSSPGIYQSFLFLSCIARLLIAMSK